MMEWIKRVLLIICIITIVITTVIIFNDRTISENHSAKWENAFEDTASKNMVTAIYLDYRLFDTYIEAVILFVAVGGIIFMSKKDQDVT